MTDNRIIDIRTYFKSHRALDEQAAFGVWGGAGERSRFALPLWRSVYLVGGDWGGIVYLPDGEESEAGAMVSATPLAGSPFFILDLHSDPARTGALLPPYPEFRDRTAPSVISTPDGGLAILLGRHGGRWWFLLIQGEGGVEGPEGKDLETLLFLAGECAGLLFLRDLEKDPGPEG